MSLFAFEADLLSTFLGSKERYVKLSSRLKPDHFRNEILRWTFETLSDHYDRYGKMPVISAFKNELMKSSLETDEKRKYYKIIKKLYKRKPKNSFKYLSENIEEKIGKEEFLIAIENSIRKIEAGKSVKGIRDSLLEKLVEGESSFEGEESIRLLEDWKVRQKLREDLSKIPVHKRYAATPYAPFNAAIRGIQIGEVATIAGTTGMGKSIMAGEFGTNSFLDYRNVLHYTLENLAEQTAGRYDARLSEVEYDTIKFYEFDKSQLKHFKNIFEVLSKNLKNDIIILETVKDETTMISVEKKIEKLRLEGFNTDFLIIDSCDLMASTKKYDSHRIDRASIYWDFKFLIKRLKIFGLTTTHLKASSKYKVSTVEDLAEAYDKARILDKVFIMSQTKEQEKDDIQTIILGKNRDGPGNIKVDLFRDGPRMRFLEVL